MSGRAIMDILNEADGFRGDKLKAHSAVNKIYRSVETEYNEWRSSFDGRSFVDSQKKLLGCACTVCMEGYDRHDRRVTLDHLEPKRRHLSKGMDKSNLLVMCNDCNSKKGSKEFKVWRKGLPNLYRQSIDESISLIHGQAKLEELIQAR